MTSSTTSAAPARSSAAKESKRKGSGHPWRENIEAVTMAIVVAIFLKYFVVEAYKIPTGSMQPTLMGNAETGIFDRILVDKLSYHFRDPLRFEVAVFRYPLDRSKNFIKRIWGMPDEWIVIRHGDILQRKTEQDPWQVLRRPESVQSEAWRRLELENEWRVDHTSEGWKAEGERILAAGPGSARFPRTAPSVTDGFLDGYPQSLLRDMRPNPQSGLHEVGDLRLQGRVTAEASTAEVAIELREHLRHYRLLLPGPAAPEGARPAIVIQDPEREQRIEAEESYRLPAGRAVSFAGQNLDDQLRLEVGGRTLVEAPIEPAAEQGSSITLSLAGGGGRFEDLQALRDIYYTQGGSGGEPWKIPPEHYMMFGDNTQDSADSREWRWTGYTVHSGPEAGLELRGQLRTRENPQIVAGRPQGTEIYFRDEQGERHVFLAQDATRTTQADAPFVHRDLVTGRALLVFWPFSLRYGVYRLKWIR